MSFTDDAGNPESLTSAATAAVAARPNTPATGQPTISGTAQVGETLTADTSGIDDQDDLENAAFSYQWVKSNGLRETDIEGTTDSAYTLVAADLGKAIKVRVSFTDGGGHEEKLTSAATAVVVAWPITDTTGAPAITGNVRVGKALTANTSQIANAHGSDDATFSYQWIRNDGTVDTEIGEANGSTYTLTEDDEDKTLKVRVTFVADAGAPESVTSAPTSLVKAEDADTSSNGQTIHLTFDDGPHPVYTPQLLDLLESYGARAMFFVNGVNVERYPDIIARMAADGHGIGNHTWGHERLTGLTEEEFTDTITRTQEALGAQGSMCLRPPYGAITHTRRLWAESLGFEVVMWTVEASDGEIARTGVDSVAARIASQVTDGSIVLLHDGGGHGRTVLAVNKMLAHLTKLGYQFEPVCQPPELAEEESPENNVATGLPTISGTVQVGETLTADVSDIDDQDGLENSSFSYQWLADDAEIQGATDSAYTLVADDEGKAIKVRVSFTDDAGNEETLTSAATEEVAARPDTKDSPVYMEIFLNTTKQALQVNPDQDANQGYTGIDGRWQPDPNSPLEPIGIVGIGGLILTSTDHKYGIYATMTFYNLGDDDQTTLDFTLSSVVQDSEGNRDMFLRRPGDGRGTRGDGYADNRVYPRVPCDQRGQLLRCGQLRCRNYVDDAGRNRLRHVHSSYPIHGDRRRHLGVF